MEVVLFDDARAGDWMPLALTRPVGELLFGAHTFRDRALLLFGSCAGHLADDALRGFDEPGAAPVLSAADLTTSVPRLYLSSRAVIEWNVRFDPGPAGVVRVGGVVAGCYVPDGAVPPTAFLRDPGRFDVRPDNGGASFEPVRGEDRTQAAYDLPGRVLENVWDLVAGNAAQIERDFHGSIARRPSGTAAFPGVHVLGDAALLRAAEGVTIEPGVLIDVTSGPVWLETDVTVRAFSRVQGPLYAGRGTTLLGGPYSGVSVGPVCKIHGELEESVVLGYSNKAHDGFLGHAYLGRWVNLGALTTNSDLKNNYGTIRLWTPRGEQDTHEIKMGCLLGDHVKTGIGVMLNTGTVIGAGSNVFGAVQPPKYVPAFHWGSGDSLVDYALDRFLETAEVVMRRREVPLSGGQRELLRRAWQRAHEQGSAEAT